MSVVLAYMITHLNLDYDTALELIRSVKLDADPIENFVKTLKELKVAIVHVEGTLRKRSRLSGPVKPSHVVKGTIGPELPPHLIKK